jgi:hypothetical protein
MRLCVTYEGEVLGLPDVLVVDSREDDPIGKFSCQFEMII